MKTYICNLAVCAFIGALPVHSALTFERNQGQTDPVVQYLARTHTGVVFLTDSEIVFHREKSEPVRISFAGSKRAGRWEAMEPTGHRTNYFVGRDPQKWIHGLEAFRRAKRANLYPGIDLILYGNSQDQFEYDLVVAPGADPSQIRIRTGSTKAVIDSKTGDLVIGGIRQHKPLVYQGRARIEGSFKLQSANEYGFVLANYDRAKPLVIDPVIESRDYIGGSGDDSVIAASGDASVGTTSSVDFPEGRSSVRHGTDVFIRTALETRIMGGSGDETAAKGSAPFVGGIVAGTTTSRDLPTYTRNVGQQLEYAGGVSDGFLWRTDALYPYVAYFGTSGEDRIHGIFESFAIVGSTNGTDLPVGENDGPQPRLAGGFDAFIAVGSMSTDRWQLYMATYVGGSGDDHGYAIARDYSSTSYDYVIGGETSSVNFPLVSSMQGLRSGATDGFLCRFRSVSDIWTILNSTLFGGDGIDRIQDLVAVDRKLTAVGTTSSTNLPYARNTYRGGSSDGFVFRLKPDVSSGLDSVYIGGTGADSATAAAGGPVGRIYVGGRTASRDFPLKSPAQAVYGGGAFDGFLVEYDSSTQVAQSTYFGGSGDDEVLFVQFISGRAFFGGTTTSADLPGSSLKGLNSYRGGARDGFVAQISETKSILLPANAVAAANLSRRIPMQFTAPSVSGDASVRSSDPSLVVVSFANVNLGQVLVASAVDYTKWESERTPFGLNLECLRNSGEATVTVSATGYNDQSVRVTCMQAALSVPTNVFSIPLESSSDYVFGGVVPVLTDPETGELIALSARSGPGVVPIEVSITSSNPSVAYGVARYTKKQSLILGKEDAAVVAVSLGTALFTFAAPGFQPVTRTVEIRSPLGASAPIAIAAGCRVSQYYDVPNGSSLTVRSLNPDRVLLSFSETGPTSSSLSYGPRTSFPWQVQYWLRGAPGTSVGSEAQIEAIVSPSQETFRRSVRFYPLNVNAGPFQNPVFMPIGNWAMSIPVSFNVGPATGCSSPEHQSTQIPIQSSAPNVSWGLTIHLQSPYPSMDIAATAEGTATLTLLPPPGLRLSSALARPIQVRTYRPSVSLADFDQGNQLVSTQNVLLRQPFVTAVTCSTSTPTLIQLSRDGWTFESSVTLGPVSSQGPRLYVLGRAAQGTGRITCEIPGLPPFSANARLRPSGYVFPNPQLNVQVGTTSYGEAAPAAIDPVNNLPIEIQSIQRSATLIPIPSVETSPQGIVSAAFPFPRPVYNPVLEINALKLGEAVLTLRQPAGFVTPSVQQTAKVVVISPPPVWRAQVRLLVLGNGTVRGALTCTTNPCVNIVDSGTQISWTATPAAGFVFKGWTAQVSRRAVCSAPAAQCDFVAEPDAEVVALFEPDKGGLHFLPVGPCRLVDTRLANGPLGGPVIAPLSPRNFPVRSACGLPTNAAAYSLNVTVVPRGPLGYVTIWPGGQTRPLASTLNAVDGRIKANAAIVPAGSDGSVDFFATEATDVVIDVNGVFVPQGSTSAGQAFYAVTPCRIADTRVSGGPLAALATRAFTVATAAGCGVPTTATAYAINVTAVPKSALGYLTLWPGGAGSARPTVSTLNALTGTVTANMAVVPAGSAGNINAYATDQTEVIVDVAGYFAPPGQPNALTFRAMAPCRLLDTRNANGALGGPVLEGVSTRSFQALAGGCGLPSTAKVYSLNSTVVAPGALGYLTLFPSGFARPVVSTLNAVDGQVTSNAAIVPAGLDGSISAFVSERTHLILDINGYFAP